MKKLSEFQIETLLKEFLSIQSVLKLIGVVLRKYEPKTPTEWELFSIFSTVQIFVVINPYTKYRKIIVSLGIRDNVCRYSDNVIIVFDRNTEPQIFNTTVYDFTFKQSVFVFQIT